ncbi:alpha-isopropylmalate synthase regulatory domain-containing protein [Ruminococcus sp.]|uniref:alpha-isopropylmalate synthase regulatory domain-containing protein n=1 Tax=Ruminococcus sp. TaxID=41978 RepID=UPI002E7FF5E2|nr:alpha-isopropylmalate synthase regulatory domain-containing protein [Ruminococcus sp.]MEE3491490.1 alpha-isopropylmalate synthase regulatory domain-containing protein [Ruminococcus sp.]
MNHIKIADTTLSDVKSTLTFKQKLEIARKLERLHVDAVELPEVGTAKADSLLVRTAASFVKDSVLSVAAASSPDAIERAADALSTASHPRIRIELPMTASIMEYTLHIKQHKMCDYVKKMIEKAKSVCDDVEFTAVDATRAEEAFLKEAVKSAVDVGATMVTLCDDAAILLPDDFAAFVVRVTEGVDVPVGVKCNNKNGVATAAAILAVKNGASCVKTSIGGEATPLREFGSLIKDIRENYGITADIRTTELLRTIDQIEWIISGKTHTVVKREIKDDGIRLSLSDTIDTVRENIEKIGYDLPDEDVKKVYEEFRRIARKKSVGIKELDAIVASAALQVPETYSLENYVINSGNRISSSAQIALNREGRTVQGIAIGDGPIDAAFHAIEQIIGRRFELDDFSIQTVTQEKEAMGNALVRLRVAGRIYSGTGLSTDIIGASIRAYISAVNKIVYEEE